MSRAIDNPLELHEVPAMLDYIHADERDTWIRVGMGLRHEFGELAFDAYDSWSQTGNGYKAADTKSAWKSFRGDALRIASVIQMAQQNGWKREQREMPAAERERIIADRAAAQAKRAIEDAKAEALEQSMRDKVTDACRTVWEQHCSTAGESAYLNNKKVENGPARFMHKPKLRWLVRATIAAQAGFDRSLINPRRQLEICEWIDQKNHELDGFYSIHKQPVRSTNKKTRADLEKEISNLRKQNSERIEFEHRAIVEAFFSSNMLDDRNVIRQENSRLRNENRYLSDSVAQLQQHLRDYENKIAQLWEILEPSQRMILSWRPNLKSK